ncbi:exodeoxyribonuclease V subunit gamma [Glaciecola sp. MH2013]|uniref:exodeoxyribonuclease V subunit gamma n=1 Tax=Glaciecola sp. MH2013 TaxID=2785524 RepID=UPI00189D190C|nr:exodeoxyribonuclease V subunit gamma [Glaciecola sp. MH2013]MBF7073034.1 exodeoxyribonuclease V subunit gamma [Glaciecola sp. MH2013]
MLTLYPSNKLEHLSLLLNAVLKKSEQAVLQAKTILVESTGMQHWLNMQIAQHNGIAMNLEFPMPTRFVWQLCRSILGEDKVPYQSVYKREVMQWRIDKILQSREFLDMDFEASIESYWQSQDNIASLQTRRIELSRHIADTFEQYLMFRPQWLLTWEDGGSIDVGELTQLQKNAFEKHEVWQSWLWKRLVDEEPNHPVRLQQKAIEHLAEMAHVLPKEIYFFGINTMAPQTLSFFSEIAKYSHVHFFHLNPCVDYWGDIRSDKSLAAKVRQGKIDAWIEQQSIHPLLRNLGQQGKDLFNLLANAQNYEIAAFDSAEDFTNLRRDDDNDQRRMLNRLAATQLGILEGKSELSNEQAKNIVAQEYDDSIILRSCHSALREVQVLHDYLLQKLNEDPTLEAHDILVMCPAIEDYSPFINAIFSRGISALNGQGEKKVPCSIADRNPLDAEPLIAVFMQMLALPDSRFSVVDLLSFCRNSSVMAKFNLHDDDLHLFTQWIEKSNIFWGLDAQHRSAVLGTNTDEGAKATTAVDYTWEWGLSRLLDGFICGDHTQFGVDGNLLIDDVEGQQSIALGRLMQVIERLEKHRRLLSTFRTMSQWKDYLFELKSDLFDTSEQTHDGVKSTAKEMSSDAFAENMLSQILGTFFEHYDMATNLPSNLITEQGMSFESLGTQTWSIASLRANLEQAFSSPDSRNHFMTGQVTFCSMMPMRSIPFKIIAILGLNDEDFPRKNNQVDVNLITHVGRMVGDRSRRGDDRYLFLEAILSARETLYLSYQGKSIKTNKVKEPSLVFTEFVEHLQTLDARNGGNTPSYIAQQALHPFSEHNFASRDEKGKPRIHDFQTSYDTGWFRLMNTIRKLSLNTPDTNTIQSKEQSGGGDKSLLSNTFSLDDLIRFYSDPLKSFANRSQGLYLDKIEQEFSDVEPFTANQLDRYTVMSETTHSIAKCMSADKDSGAGLEINELLENIAREHLASGNIPNDIVSRTLLQEWLQKSCSLASALAQHYPMDHKHQTLLVNAESVGVDEIRIEYSYQRSNDNKIVAFAPSSHSLKNLIRVWFVYLAECAQEQDCDIKVAFYNIGKNTKNEATLELTSFSDITQAQAQSQLSTLLHFYNQGQQKPILAIPDLAASIIKNFRGDKSFSCESASLDDYLQHRSVKAKWEDSFTSQFNIPFFIQSPYFQHFFPEPPLFNAENLRPLLSCFQLMVGSVKTTSAVITDPANADAWLLGEGK